MKLNTYLNFNGTCAQAFAYYEKHLGAKLLSSMTYGQVPGATSLPPEQEKLILHARLDLGGTTLMASDVAPNMPWEPMRSAYLTLSVSSSQEAERIHIALAEGGQIFMALQETFYAYKFSMVRDKFGINWMIIHERPMPNPAAN
jgi:PhnB protein